MKHAFENSRKQHSLIPWALFAGVVCAFAACCVAGKRSAGKNQFIAVKRFHQRLMQESLFYPTASQIKQHALTQSRKARINVIIGGSSVLYGSGQQAHELWSDKLAALLGPDYRVINLAFRGGTTGEIGAVGAEMLMDRRKVIFITDMVPGVGKLNTDGTVYRYFFWDAWYKKLIDRKQPRRNSSLAKLAELRRADAKTAELHTGARLDSAFHFNDMWNSLMYSTGGTIWNKLTLSESFEPRKEMRDNEPPPMLRQPSQAAALTNPASIDAFIGRIIVPDMEKDALGRWMAPPARALEIKNSIDACLPNEELRRRTLVYIRTYAPFVLARMTPDKRERLFAFVRMTRDQVRAAGMHCIEGTRMFTDDEYADYIHLADSGGGKLAAEVAPIVRELAASLGYVEQSRNEGNDSR